ncbi:MAG: helix-turn-helix transcriptional regulator [Allorhizobium sp.]
MLKSKGEKFSPFKHELAIVPRLDVHASAGNGRVAVHEEPLEYLAFQADWLRRRGVNPQAARILTARGDSMEETIRDGDILLVDTSINRIRDNAIYVVSYGDMVLVKRIHGRVNGSLQLISDNTRYPAEEVPAEQVNELNIAGRVMWFGRSI